MTFISHIYGSTKSRESTYAQTKNMEESFSSSSVCTCSKASRSESTGSIV